MHRYYPGISILTKILQGINLIYVHLVTQIEYLTNPHTTKQPMKLVVVQARLRDEGESAPLRLPAGVKADCQIVLRIDRAEGIGTKNPHSVLLGKVQDFSLHPLPFHSGLRESARHDDNPFDALLDTLPDNAKNSRKRNRNYDKVYLPRYVPHASEGRQSRYLGGIRIHGV